MSTHPVRKDERPVAWYLYLLPLVLFLIGWYLLTTGSSDRQFIFSSPYRTWLAFLRLTANGELVRHTAITVFEAVSGFIAGTAIGASAGLALWYSRTLASIVRPYVAALASIPMFALAPMIIVWFGIGIFSKIALAFLCTFVVALVQSYQGATSVEQKYLRLMQIVGASSTQTFRFVVMPTSIIWVVNAMKLNVGLALLGAFIGEFISAEAGLGYMIVKASGLYDMATVLVGVATLMLVALALTFIVEALEHRLLIWKYRY